MPSSALRFDPIAAGRAVFPESQSRNFGIWFRSTRYAGSLSRDPVPVANYTLGEMPCVAACNVSNERNFFA